MADDNYNCALAHAVCYGLQHFEHVERDDLHGDLVAYGALVQLMLDGQADKARELTDDLLSKVLFSASMEMKNGFARSDS